MVVDRLRVEGQAGDLRQRSEAVVAALRPQGERLHTVELDLALGGAVLRSIPQDMRRGRFFQVDLDATGLELHRHARSRAGGRSAEPFALTRDELGRIIEDIGQIMAGGEIRDGDRGTVR